MQLMANNLLTFCGCRFIVIVVVIVRCTALQQLLYKCCRQVLELGLRHASLVRNVVDCQQLLSVVTLQHKGFDDACTCKTFV